MKVNFAVKLRGFEVFIILFSLGEIWEGFGEFNKTDVYKQVKGGFV